MYVCTCIFTHTHTHPSAHRVIVRICLYVCTCIHTHTHTHTHTRPLTLQPLGEAWPLGSSTISLVAYALGPRQHPDSSSLGTSVSRPCLCSQCPLSLPLFTPSLIWSCLTPLPHAALLQIPSALMPTRVVPEIISEKAKPDFVCLCLCWGVLIVFLSLCIDSLGCRD